MFDCAARHLYTAVQDSNIARKKVTRERESKLSHRPSTFARVLSFVLLGFIVYGTTVEAAHTHGTVARVNNASSSSSFSDPASESKANNNLPGCGDCLICQLHQNFSATVISVPPSIGPLSVEFHFFHSNPVSVASQTNAPRRGRAPPFSL